MTKPCPSCGAATIPEARFCRRCGTPLRVGAQGNGSEMVSPLAATVPLTEEGRTTDGLPASDPRRAAPDTSRVNRTELEAILRSTQEEPANGAQASVQPAIPHDAEDTIEDEQTPRALHDGGSEPPEPSIHSPRDYTTHDHAAYTVEGDNAATDEEELTITVPRRSEPFSEHSAPLRVQPIPIVRASSPLASGTLPATVVATPPPGDASSQPPRRLWPVVVATCVGLLLVAVAVGLLVSRWRSEPRPVEAGNTAPPVPASDPKKLSEEKMTEAEGLLASGDLSGAVARMREAVQLDPSNVRAHRRLADVLLESGARREAIEELRAVTRSDPNDFTVWRALGFAQLGEGLYEDAAESFRRLLALTDAAQQDPNDLLAYADALRQAGHTEEAQAIYQKLSSATVAEIASAARRHLSEMAASLAPTPEPTPATPSETAQSQIPQTTQTPAVNVPTPAPQPTPAPALPTPTPPAQRPATSPDEHYTRGVSLWASNRAAALQEFRAAGKQHPDANYYLGLSYIQGRDMRSLKRPEIVAALEHFQIARRGRFAGQAQQYERQLGREFDRLRR